MTEKDCIELEQFVLKIVSEVREFKDWYFYNYLQNRKDYPICASRQHFIEQFSLYLEGNEYGNKS